jgi:hypothetical protein
MPIFTTGTPLSTHAVISSRRASSSAQPAPCPSGHTGRTTDTTCLISSSVSCPSPPSRDRPAATAALTYRLLVLRSTPAAPLHPGPPGDWVLYWRDRHLCFGALFPRS